jgi:hypothetical protein
MNNRNIYNTEVKDIDLFDGELCDIIQKYFVKGWTSKNNELFFDDDEIIYQFNLASNILQNLIKEAQGR